MVTNELLQMLIFMDEFLKKKLSVNVNDVCKSEVVCKFTDTFLKNSSVNTCAYKVHLSPCMQCITIPIVGRNLGEGV